MSSARSRWLSLALCLLIAAPAAASKPTPPPFDPSLHAFRETMSGGIAIVVAHGVSHAYVSRIRSTLRQQAGDWEHGRYAEPSPAGKSATAALRAGASRIAVAYADIDSGGAITLRTSDPALVRAIHDWFAAEVTAERAKNPRGGPGDVP